MVTQLTSIIRSFSGSRVLLVGDLILDQYIYGDAERISPEAPVPVIRAVERQERVGGTANVAACVRALGASVQCCGAIADDRGGRRLKVLLDELGVDCDGLIVTDDRPTTTKTRLVGLAQHRHRQQLLRLDEESTAPLPEASSDELLKRVEAMISNVDVVCIEDYQKGVVSRRLVETIVRSGRQRGIPVVVDPAGIPNFDLYSGVTAMTPNRVELEKATGMRFESAAAVMEVVGDLLSRWDVECLVVTLDREGAVVAQRGSDPVHVPTRPRSVYDNTGAGDAVLACLAASVATGADWADAVRLANIAGGLEVEKFGCVPVTADEMLADLRIEHRRRNGKVRTTDDLVAELTLRRDRGETVVFTNGVFDVLHPGHVSYLAAAREFGSVLVVGVNADESVRQLEKGTDRPINDQGFRTTMLGALECVDYVVVFDEPDPLNLIKRLRPDVLVKGADWAKKGVVGREFVESIGGSVQLVSLVEGYSTTAILERIRSESKP
jgi:D-beta-D-heptose 7-phosphate kinase / D-beta-D-heptose 1-phosphate adenosyltransferase